MRTTTSAALSISPSPSRRNRGEPTLRPMAPSERRKRAHPGRAPGRPGNKRREATRPAQARQPVGRPSPLPQDPSLHLSWLEDEEDFANLPTEGILDEDFDDLGCDVGTLLRLANGA